MIWIRLPQRCCELQAAHRCCWAEGCREAGDGNEAPSRLPAAEAAPAEGAAGDSWQDVLWLMWHTGSPAVAENKSKRGYDEVWNLLYVC